MERTNLQSGDGMASDDEDPNKCRRRRFVNVLRTYAIVTSLIPKQVKTRKHTSILTGGLWMKELWDGNDSRFSEQFRMSKSAMASLVHVLQEKYGFLPFRTIIVDESVAMFLQIVGHEVTFPLVTERFQHSSQTVSHHFQEVLDVVCLLRDDIISHHLVDFESVHPHIENNMKYNRAFRECVGAIDGCHIQLRMGEVDVVAWRNRKGVTSTNCLAVVDFDMCFIFARVGTEGSMHDSWMLYEVLSDPTVSFPIPPNGKYYLADSGFPNIKGFLTPNRGTRYHLPDFRQAGVIRNMEENFNYHHSSLRSVVERTFGIWKSKWKILEDMTWFPLEVQLQIVWASMALHNWVRQHDMDDGICRYEPDLHNECETSMSEGACSWTPVRPRESNEMHMLRDNIRDTLTLHNL